MKTIIAGSRSLHGHKEFVLKLIGDIVKKNDLNISEVISGGAKGVDRYAELYADLNDIPTKIFLASWEIFGRKAGFLRNERMAERADQVILINLNRSKGTAHMCQVAKELKLPVYEIHLSDKDLPLEKPIDYTVYKSPDI